MVTIMQTATIAATTAIMVGPREPPLLRLDAIRRSHGPADGRRHNHGGVYLPGATPDSGMVEVRLQSAGQSQLVRLAPVGFLKQSGLLLREGDTVTVKGFPVAGMEGDLLIATELHKGEKTLSLRDTRGRPAW